MDRTAVRVFTGAYNESDNHKDTQSDNERGGQTDISDSSDSMSDMKMYHSDEIDNVRCRYPHSIVWTPIPLIT